MKRSLTMLGLLALMTGFVMGLAGSLSADEGKFIDLGIPVLRAGVYKTTLGPDGSGEMTRIYAVFTQNAAPVFLVQIDPYTGTAKQFNAPLGTHPWGLVVGPDNCVYIGTAGEEDQGGLLLRFDPAHPEKGVVNLGKMAASETYVWALTRGEGDGWIYGCSYGNGKVTGYDTRTGKFRDYGQMKPGQQYTRPIVAGKDGWVYTAAGTTAPDYIALDPRTGEHGSSRPAEIAGTPVAELAQGGWGVLRKGIDGHAYQRDNGQWYRLVGGKASPISESELPPSVVPRLKDGRELVGVKPEGEWTLRDPATGQETSGRFEYKSAGMKAFVLGQGPDGKIYGSTMLPLWLFRTDPATGRHEILGKASHVGGELYSMLPLDGQLWMFAYPEAYISRYDPARPENYGDGPDNNPRNYGPMGDGHLRPRALILGPGKKFYVGSFAPYGELGGSMGVFDPALGKTVENYRHLIRNQSISALAYDPKSGLVFGGSDIGGGGGTSPSEATALFFVWDPAARKLLKTAPLVEGDTGTVAMTVARGKVFVVTRPSNTLSIWDIAGGKVIDRRPIDCGDAVEISLGTHTDGRIYGLTEKGVMRVDPKTHEIRLLAAYEPGVSVGWVMNAEGIYFASGVRLIRWEWPGKK